MATVLEQWVFSHLVETGQTTFTSPLYTTNPQWLQLPPNWVSVEERAFPSTNGRVDLFHNSTTGEYVAAFLPTEGVHDRTSILSTDAAMAFGVSSSERLWAKDTISQFMNKYGVNNITPTGISRGAGIAALVSGDLGLTGGIGFATPNVSDLLNAGVNPATVSFTSYNSPNDNVTTDTISGGGQVGTVILIPDPDAQIINSMKDEGTLLGSTVGGPVGAIAGRKLAAWMATVTHEHTFGLGGVGENNYGQGLAILFNNAAFANNSTTNAHFRSAVNNQYSKVTSGTQVVRTYFDSNVEAVEVHAVRNLRTIIEPDIQAPKIDLDSLTSQSLGWIQSIDLSTGAESSAAVRMDGESAEPVTISFSELGSFFGSNLAKFVNTGDPFGDLAVGTLFGTIGLEFGQAVELGQTEASHQAVTEAFDDIDIDIRAAGAAAISSYLFAQFVNAIGIHGVFGQAVDTVGGAVVGQIASNIATNAATFANVNLLLVENAAGAFLGTYLASQIFHFDTVEGQIGASIGSAAGAIAGVVAATEIGAVLGSQILANILLPGIGAFLGFALGGVLGSLFGGGTPRSSTGLIFDGKQFIKGASWSVHGSNEAANSLASSVAAVLNAAVTATGAQLTDGWRVRAGAYGMDGSDYVYWAAGDDRTLNKVAARFKNVNDLVNTGAYIALSDMAPRMAGGDVYIKRAIAGTLTAAGGNTGTFSKGQFAVETLNGNISIAKDYESYLANSGMIDALIAAEPTSTFAAGWLATLAQAFALGLDKRASSDWAGGWNVFMDESKDGKIDGDAFTPGNLTLSLDSSSRERTFSFSDENGGFLGSFGDTINSADKTEITATSGNDSITVSGDTISNTTGLTINGTAANGSAKKIDVAAVIDAGAGDDTVRTGDLGNDVWGGTGNDTLVGGKLDDWLFGDDGNDRLFAGAVSTTSFTDTDTTSINAALAADGGNGNYLEGGAGDDRLYGSTGSDWLSGSAGNDVEYGGDGGDILTGGAGSDNLQGGEGTDQYLFSFGDGADTVFDATIGSIYGSGGLVISSRVSAISASLVQRDWAGDGTYTTNGSVAGGVDAIVFGPGISMINLEMARSGNDMIIKLGTWDAGFNNFTLTGDQLTVKDWFTDDRTIEWFRFADGEEIRMADLGSVVRGTSGNNYIVGTNGSDFLFGLGGADSIRSMGGNDFAYGGSGDDFITGDGGDDLVVGGSGDDRVQGNAGQDTLTGDDGNDNIYGGAGDDIISGGKGNDFLAGGAGNDIFKYSRGDGSDTVIDEYVNSWETVWTGAGGYQNGYALNGDGTVSKSGTTYFNDGWIGFYTYDADTQVLKRFTGTTSSVNSGTDTIEFATGIDIQDIEFQNQGGDLVMGIMADGNDGSAFAGLTDKITIKSWFSSSRTIENVEFTATGLHNFSTWTLSSLTDGNDSPAVGGSGSDWMTGLAGDDVLDGGSGNDIIAGDQGNDTLKGNGGDDVLYGGAGNDSLMGGSGKDQLIGGAGEDTASYEVASSAVRVSLGFTLANTGDAFGDVFTGIEDIKGTTAPDTLIGDDNDNMLIGGQGSDTLRGGLGDDTYVIDGDIINDVGISGAEEVLDVNGILNSNYTATWTALGTTVVSGTTYYAYRLAVTDNRTSQVVYQSRDNVDFLYSSSGQTLPAGSAWPFANGQWLLDTMRTANGIQTVRTFDGSGGGNDALLLQTMSLSQIDIARSGADLLLTLGAAQTRIKNQTISSSAIERLLLVDGLQASLTNLKLAGDAATSGDDFFQGNSSANTFHGGDGNDIISGRQGADLLYGDNGDDVLEGGDGTDTLDGGSDSETLGLAPDPTNMTKPFGDTIRYVGSTAAVSVNLATRAVSGGEAAGDIIVAVNGVSTIENVTGSDGYGDTLTGDSRANRLFGLGGNDNLTGAAGDDVLVGGAGTDTLHGDDGNDNLSGGDGDDIIYGGNNNDLLSGDAGNDNLYGELGDDILSGGDGNDTLSASDGNDQLGGDAGVDTLNGDNGDDALSGGDGDDSLYGGAGNDTLSGDAGNDIVQGGLNDDTYIFSTAGGNDTLTDSDGKNGIVITDATHDQIWLGQNGSDLMVGIVGSTASIRVVNYFAATTPSRIFSIATTDQILFLNYAGPLMTAMGAISGSAPSAMPQSISDMLATYWDVGTKAAPRVTDQSPPPANEDTVVTGSVGAVDHDDNITAYATASAPGHGTLSLNAVTGAWSYTPTANYNGADSFSIRVTDADQQSVTQTVSITLLPVPDPPDVPTITPSVSSVAERDNPDPTAPVPAAIQLGILSGTDPDLTPAEALQQLVYTVSDPRFEIRTGNELWLRAGVMSSIDFEASPTLSVNVTVSDNSGTSPGALTNSQTFNFAIADQVDYFIGGPNNDTITGTVGPDYIAGNGNNDMLSGLGGNDSIFGGGADDNLDGGAGNDYLQGDAGYDTLLGGSGDDTLLGGDDDDSLDGGSGNDALNGGLGNDTLIGGAGADAIDGGAGTDTLTYAAAGAGVTVNLATGIGTGGDALGDTITGVERVIGSAYADTLTGTTANEYFDGGAGDDVISGGGGTDTLYGGAGNDTITGGDGADIIYGDDGDDHLIGGLGQDALYGGNGNDWLEAQDDGDLLDGGTGNDILDGGIGSDSYVLDINSGNDTIYDFDPDGTDKDQVNYTNVDPSWLWFQQVNTNDLKISIIGSTATATVMGWFANVTPPANRRIEMLVTNTHYTLDVDGLTSLMVTKTKPANLTALATLMADSTYANSWSGYWGLNAAPVIAAIANKTTNEDTAANVAISASDDTTPANQLIYDLKAYNNAGLTQQNTTFTQSWSVSGPANGQTLQITPATNVSGTLYMVLTVSDLTGRASQQTFTLTITPVADTPILTTPSNVVGTLDSGSAPLNISANLQDTDGSETLKITITGLPTGLTLNNGTNLGGGTWSLTQANLTGLTINGPATWGTDFTLGVTATSTESVGGSTATTTNHSVPVTINARPTGITGSLSVNENSTSGTNAGTVVGSDPDNDPLTYTLISDANGRFAINASGVLTVSNGSLLNYEAASSHTITVRAQDPSGLYKDVNLSVAINDVNEAPSIVNNGPGYTPENQNPGTLVGSVSASDPDTYGPYRNFYYQLVGGDTGSFYINSSTGSIYASSSLDYESHPAPYNVTARVWDGGSPGSGLYNDVNVPITVGNLNEAPSVSSNTWSVAENAPGGGQTLIGHVNASDPDAGASLTYSFLPGYGGDPIFSISSNGNIYLQSTLNYEGTNSYTFAVQATDQLGASTYNWQTINVTNVNETPYISGLALVDQEWVYNDYYPDSTYLDNTLAIYLGDPDGDSVGLYDGWNRDALMNGGGNVYYAYWQYWPYQDNPALWPLQLPLRALDGGGLYTDYTLYMYQYGSATIAPIVLDLDGNGVDLVSIHNSFAWFDSDGDGYRDHTGWAGPNDGILALDLDGNGLIDRGDEIRFASDVDGSVSDLEGLRAFDTNNDGFLDAGDDRFSDFRVWQDINQDGVSQTGELTSLTDRSIAAINLTLTPTGASLDDQTDNVLYGSTDFVRTDGSYGTAGDVSFLYQRNGFTPSLDGTTEQEMHVTPPPAPGQLAPVVLDLDGNGVVLESRFTSSVIFDADADGTAERTGWIGPDDGLLALDRNGDGVINDGSEISFKQDVTGAISDLEGLNAYDSNQNGFVDEDDERFAEFLVWRDTNQDGKSAPDELASLASYGIQSIGLTRHMTGQAIEGAADNVVYATADVVHRDGSISEAGDVFLSYDRPTSSDLDQNALPDFAAISHAEKTPVAQVNSPFNSAAPQYFNGNSSSSRHTSAPESNPDIGSVPRSPSNDQQTSRKYADTKENFRSVSHDAYTALSKNALNPQGGPDAWSTTLAASHGIGSVSAVDIGVGLLDQQMLQMVAAIAAFNAGSSGTMDAAERARRHFEGTEFLTAVPRTDFASGPHVA